MKTTQIFFGKHAVALLLLSVLMFNAVTMMAQDVKETRQQKKERQKKEREIQFQTAKAMLFDTTFVVPAKTISLNSGQTFNINSTINFLRLSGNEGTLQISSYLSPDRGLNNRGELFVKGPLTFVKYTEKKEQITLYFLLNGQTGKLRITVSINGSNDATVFVDGNIGGPAFQLSGKLVQVKDAQIYERKQN